METGNRLVFSWGANSYGQLSQHHTEDVLKPQKVVINSSPVKMVIEDVVGGGGHTIAVITGGNITACGLNDRGQLGIGKCEKRQRQRSRGNSTSDVDDDVTSNTSSLASVPTPNLTVSCFHPVPIRRKIKTVACGWDHSLAMTDAGSLYVWGSNAFGQIGLSSEVKESKTPHLVSFEVPGSASGMRLTSIGAGLRHSLALSDDGAVLTCGAGRRGQLGFQLPDKTLPSKSFKWTQVWRNSENGSKVMQVFAGSFHSGVLVHRLAERAHSLWMWGCNKYGQLCLDSEQLSVSSFPVERADICPGQRIMKVASGWTHLVAISENGQLFSWGRNCYGQLGRSSENTHDSRPLSVSLPNSQLAADVVCGSEHSLVLSDTGELYSFGWNEHGMCGVGDEANRTLPVKVTVKDFFSPSSEVGRTLIDDNTPFRWTKIGAGYGHSFAIGNTKR